jgi:chromosome segregation ATPase
MAEREVAAAEAEASASECPQHQTPESTNASVGGGASLNAGERLSVSQSPSDEDEDVARFSAAQLRVRLAQARLEAKMAADDELLALRKRLVEAEYALQERERARQREGERLNALQQRVDGIVQEHRRTLSGMQGDLSTEKLVAALETEKEVRVRLRAAFEKQSAELSAAERRVEELDAQVQHYQKTETVLSQSVAHFQHRFEAKDQQRAAALDRARQKIEAKFIDEVAELRRELELARRTEKMAQDELVQLQRERDQLRERVESVAVLQTEENAREDDLLARIAALETDKAVLQSKAEQVEKADAQLRSKVNTQIEEIEHLRRLNEGLLAENKELAELANELVEMAEKQHEEKLKRRSIDPNAAVDADADREEGEFLQQRKKRLRLSLG